MLFLKRLDDRENAAERQAKRKGIAYQAKVPKEMRWGYWTQMKAEESLRHLKEEVFPWLRKLGEGGSSFEVYMKTAECKINRPGLLIEACKLIDQMQISQQNQDVQGDLYEYMLGNAIRRAQRPVPHAAAHYPHDGADDGPETARAHWRPGGRDVRLSGQRVPVYFGEAYVGGHFGVRRRRGCRTI